LDLRDYLFHAYNVRALGIRSHVKQQAVRDSVDAPRRFFRPEAKKFMTIEMDRPFVWPEKPESWEAWGKREKKENVNLTVAQLSETMHDKAKAAAALRRQATGLVGKTRPLQEWEKTRTAKTIEGDEGDFRIKI
jgi:large subunit ribosomal protein L23